MERGNAEMGSELGNPEGRELVKSVSEYLSPASSPNQVCCVLLWVVFRLQFNVNVALKACFSPSISATSTVHDATRTTRGGHVVFHFTLDYR